MRAGGLAQSKSQKLRNRIPDEEVARIEGIAVAQFLEAAQCFSCCDEGRCRIDDKMPLELLCRNVESCLWGLATGDCVRCRSTLAWS